MNDDTPELDVDAAEASTNGHRPDQVADVVDRLAGEELERAISRDVKLTLRAIEELDMRLTAVQTELLICGLSLLLVALTVWRRGRA